MISLLPLSVIDRVRTGVGISSFSQACRALLENALDAGPSLVAIEIDIQSGFISVMDDGVGIQDLNLVCELAAIGISCTGKIMLLDRDCILTQVGLRYCSGKQQGGETLGNKGESLASLAEICTELKVFSR